MQRSAQNLSARWSEELGRGGARADLFFHLGGERDQRGKPRWEVEGGEHREGIAERKERVAGKGDAPLRNGRGGRGGGRRLERPEHACELGVFVEA